MLHEQLQGKFPSTSTEVHWSSSSFLIKFLNPWWDRIPPKITTRSEMWKYTLIGSERLFLNRHFPNKYNFFQELGRRTLRSVPEYVLNLQLIVYLDLYILGENVTFKLIFIRICTFVQSSMHLAVWVYAADVQMLQTLNSCFVVRPQTVLSSQRYKLLEGPFSYLLQILIKIIVSQCSNPISKFRPFISCFQLCRFWKCPKFDITLVG